MKWLYFGGSHKKCKKMESEVTPKRKKILIVLRVIISALFIFSGLSKMFPEKAIHFFELDLVNKGLMGWELAPYFSRLLIGFELFLGLSFFHNGWFKRVIAPATFLLLLAFSVYLLRQIFTSEDWGMSGDCGCFGSWLPMNPFESFLKNLVLGAMVVWAYFLAEKDTDLWKVPLILGLSGYLFIFIVRPICPACGMAEEVPVTNSFSNVKVMDDTISSVQSSQTIVDSLKKKNKNTTIPKSQNNITVSQTVKEIPHSNFYPFHNFSNNVIVNLDEGTNLICLFDPDCDHCKAVAKRIASVRKTIKTPSVFIFFMEGNDRYIPSFFSTTGLGETPYKVLGATDYFRLLKTESPSLFLLKDGQVKESWIEETAKEEALKEAFEKWVK